MRLFGPDFRPEPYLARAHERARSHKWYMSAVREFAVERPRSRTCLVDQRTFAVLALLSLHAGPVIEE